MTEAPKQLLPMPRDPNTPSPSTSSSSSSASHRRAPPPSPRSIPRTMDVTSCPTTFVQADTASFKQVVQMLTGAATPAAKPAGNNLSGGGGRSNGPCRPKKPAFKLYERRGSLKNLKTISAAGTAAPSPRKAAEALSPSVLDFPALALSPVTPLIADPFGRSPTAEAAEPAATAGKGFFLHPSPRSAEPPRLLPLFPLTSSRMASSAAAPSE